MTVTTIVVAGILTVLSAKLADDLIFQSVEHKVQNTLGQKAGALANPVKFKVADKIEAEVLDALQLLGDDGLAIVVLGVNGDVLFASEADEQRIEQLKLTAAQAIENGDVASSQSGSILAEPITAGKDAKLIGAISLEWSAAAAQAAILSEKIEIVAWGGAIFVLMSVLTIYLLRRFLGQPTHQLGQAMARVSARDYDTEIAMKNRPDELGTVARHLASLVETLREARDSETEKERQREIQISVVERLGAGLIQLADGVLHEEIDEAFPGQYESLKDNFNRALTGLNSVIAQVDTNSTNILGHADEIAQASVNLSRRTETQAATLEQSAAALDQMLEQIKEAANAAEETDTAVQTTSELATKSGEVMHSAISAMSEIEKSSEQISSIIKVIDDIAFQTNLLALNAGVEAARAGETGKGFAVVAAEVQGLAQRSAEAAQQIKDLIVGSTNQVQDGVQLVQSAGAALEEVRNNVSGISTMVGGIAKRASVQAEGLNEITIGVTNLDRVTQQNAGMVEETSTAAQMLRKQALDLTELVGEFSLNKVSPGDVAPMQDAEGADKAA
ncbi:MAG: methyl-accepting chemotaxis protein [Pelagimonas sp.]|uniref:methyl-accepting chemotaxis protein n=1 Tax=Pelagimonas sp. TaxID=2073170 RepID=UPI003D6BF2B4